MNLTDPVGETNKLLWINIHHSAWHIINSQEIAGAYIIDVLPNAQNDFISPEVKATAGR